MPSSHALIKNENDVCVKDPIVMKSIRTSIIRFVTEIKNNVHIINTRYD